MPTRRLAYPLSHSYVQNWLVAGPHALPVADLDRFEGKDREIQIAHHYYPEHSGFPETPVDRASFEVDGARLTWRYHRCLDDHWIDLSAVYTAWHYVRSWAYAQIDSPTEQAVTLTLASYGPADLWVNGQHVHRQDAPSSQPAWRAAAQAALLEGTNELLVRFEQVAPRSSPYAISLQVTPSGQEDELSVHLPTNVRRVARRQRLEELFEQAYLEGSVYCQGKQIPLHWPDDLTTRANYACQVQDERGVIYLEALPETGPGETLNVGHTFGRLWERPYDVVLRARPLEYYDHNLRYERRMPIHVLDTPYSDALYGTFTQRRTEALEHAAKRGQGIYAELAKMALGRWDDIDTDRVAEAVERVRRREIGSVVDLAGLLGALYHYLEADGFPQWLEADLREPILDYSFDAACCEAESDSLLFHTCEILAGQRYPDRTFARAGQTGAWHAQNGQKLALDWLHKRGRQGFDEWDSNDRFERDLAALSLLVDICENEQVWGLAAVVMDKLLLTMALNSFKGVFGSTHGRTRTAMIVGGQLEATSGVTRLLWGQGVWNQHAMGVVSLACSEYEMPLIVADIAVNLAPEMWNREHHPAVDKVTFRTPDYMLCSAQDYHPGQTGSEAHVWQATLGPDAVVFGNHPARMSESDAGGPNFWRGNGVLPRVAQWKDILVAVHNLPDTQGDWLDFTHAYLPVYAFDECMVQGGWAFARKGQGYLALTASQGIELVKQGPGAYRELRSYGQQNVWLCMMGRQETDGTWSDFRSRVLHSQVEMQPLSTRLTTLRGDTLSFGWEEPLVVNGREQPLAGFKHYENPFCTVDRDSAEMHVRTDTYQMTLNLAPQGEDQT